MVSREWCVWLWVCIFRFNARGGETKSDFPGITTQTEAHHDDIGTAGSRGECTSSAPLRSPALGLPDASTPSLIFFYLEACPPPLPRISTQHATHHKNITTPTTSTTTTTHIFVLADPLTSLVLASLSHGALPRPQPKHRRPGTRRTQGQRGAPQPTHPFSASPARCVRRGFSLQLGETLTRVARPQMDRLLATRLSRALDLAKKADKKVAAAHHPSYSLNSGVHSLSVRYGKLSAQPSQPPAFFSSERSLRSNTRGGG